jgi:hypothetical protein
MRTAVKFKRESITPHLAGRDLCYTVSTVPEELRQAAAHFPTWARWTKRYLKLLQDRLGLAWGWVRTDPAGKCAEAERSGEYCDCTRCSKWHPHLNLLWVRKDGRGALTEYELWLIKSLWAEVIGAPHAWDGDYVRPVVSVWHKWVPDPSTLEGKAAKAAENKLWHLYLYQGRKWPAWQKAAKKFLRIRPVGKFPAKALSEEKAEAKLRRLYTELRAAEEAGAPLQEAEIRRLEASLAAANAAGHAKVARALEKKIATLRRRLPAARIQRKIDKLRTPKPCRCGCGVVRRPEPEPGCKCCGEKIRCMPVLDQEEAEYWIREGPEAVRAEIRRRRRVGDKNGREPFEAQLVRELAEEPAELFSKGG